MYVLDFETPARPFDDISLCWNFYFLLVWFIPLSCYWTTGPLQGRIQNFLKGVLIYNVMHAYYALGDFIIERLSFLS